MARKNLKAQEKQGDSADKVLLLLLKPVLKFCLRRAVRLQTIVATVKKGLVEVAREELERGGAHVSVTRISVMTGMYRKDIQSLIEGDLERPGKLPLLARLIGQWQNHRDYSHVPGEPMELDCSGRESTFFRLVSSINKEVNAYAVLFDLERLGLVETKDGAVRLLANELDFGSDVESGARLVGDDIDDLLSIIQHNTTKGRSAENVPQLHLKTSYDNMIQEALPEIRAWLLKEGAEFHRKARDYLSQFDKDLNPSLHAKEGGGKAIVGTFGATEDE